MFTDSVLYGANPCSMFIFSLLQMSVLLLSSVEVGLLNASTDNSRSCNKYQSFEICLLCNVSNVTLSIHCICSPPPS
uniref:Putative ovule protein n=1 Tax=Solanum chacoense TaxID=4108 RepID=A0A0V0GU34_SOLCH